MSRGRSPRNTLAAKGACLLSVVACLIGPSGRAEAQEWRLSALAGRYRYESSPVGGANGTGLLGIRYVQGESWISAVGGAPLTSADASWGSLAAALRLSTARRPFEVGVRLSGQAFAQGDRADTAAASPVGLPGNPVRDVPPGRRGPLGGGVEPIMGGWGASGEITPLLAYRTPSTVVEARGGIAGFHSDFADQAFDRTLRVAYLRVARAVTSSLVLSAEGRGHWAAEGSYPYVGATAFLTRGPVDAWASAGAWMADSVSTTPWSLGLDVDVGDRVSLTGSLRRDAFDPLFQTPARTSWSLGVSVALSRPAAVRAPVPARYRDGVATLALGAAEASGAVRVAGDFNDWKPQAMTLRDGRWTLQIPLHPGVYYYAFVAPDGSWFVPESVAGRKPDGFGGWVAVLVVE